MPTVHHESVCFTGRVQGVGFRYATLQVAKEFDVAGFVQNLPDGRVQLEAEGSPADVAAFIAALEERMHGYIAKVQRNASEREPHYSGFGIR
jgi:acylphosphatase